MKYVVILLVGILLGGGAAVFFLGTPSAKSAPGQAIKPPDQGGAPPGAVVIALEQSFIDAVLSTTFNGLGNPTFNSVKREMVRAHRAGTVSGWLRKHDYAFAGS